MLANMRSVMTSLAPTIYARVYAWSIASGRDMPGLAYLVSAIFKVVAELIYQSMSKKTIEDPSSCK